MNQPIRLLAIDLDGTMFGESLHPTESVCRAVRAAAASGVKITIASGRTIPDEQRVIRELGLTADQTAPLIGYQGAYVYQPGYGELFSFTISPDVAIGIVEYSRSIGYGVNLHTPEDTYVERPTAADHYYAEVSLLQPTTVTDLAVLIRERDLHPLKMVLVAEQQEQTNRLVEALNQRWPQQLLAARSHPRFCEATNPCANKGEALSQLAALLDIPMTQVMAIGDNQNDITMLQRAGIGIVMGHATVDVKAAAKYITGTIDEDGVTQAIERFILKPQMQNHSQDAAFAQELGYSMPFCPQCNSEYEDWVQTCADCGVPLTRGAAQSSNFMRSVFRPIGALQPSQDEEGRVPPAPTETLDAAPPRHQGRNRRLKTRFLEPFHPPAEIPLPPPLPPDAVLPIALNLDLNHPRSTYDPAGDAWVVLISAPNEIMANLLRSQLADAGIPALIKLNSAVDNGEFINNAWVARNIWVQARDIERARDVVNFYHSDSPVTAQQQAEATVDENYSEIERPPLYETPWLPNEHYDDPDMIAANASVDEQGRPIQRNAYRSPLQRPWLRWLSFILLLAWVSPYLVDLLRSIWDNFGRIFR